MDAPLISLDIVILTRFTSWKHYLIIKSWKDCPSRINITVGKTSFSLRMEIVWNIFVNHFVVSIWKIRSRHLWLTTTPYFYKRGWFHKSHDNKMEAWGILASLVKSLEINKMESIFHTWNIKTVTCLRACLRIYVGYGAFTLLPVFWNY